VVDEAWAILRNLKVEGIAAEDGPGLNGRSVPLGTLGLLRRMTDVQASAWRPLSRLRREQLLAKQLQCLPRATRYLSAESVLLSQDSH